MKWRRRAVSPLRQAHIDSLRYRSGVDSQLERPLAVELLQAGMDLHSRGRHEEALAPLTETVTILGSEPAKSAQPDKLLMTALSMLGAALLQLDRARDAEAPLKQAVGIGQSLSGEIELDRNASGVMANSLIRLARCREIADDRRDAARLVEEALPLLTRWQGDPSVTGHTDSVAATLAGANAMLLRLQAEQRE